MDLFDEVNQTPSLAEDLSKLIERKRAENRLLRKICEAAANQPEVGQEPGPDGNGEAGINDPLFTKNTQP